MPIIFAAVTPNNPELSTEAASSTNTGAAIKELEGELYFMKPDTILLLTAHGSQIPECINVNIEGNLTLTSRKTARTDMEFSSHMQHALYNETELNMKMSMVAEREVAKEVATPLALLLEHLPDTKVVVMSTGTFSLREHFAFGEFLRQESLETNKRMAIIASGCVEDFSTDQHAPVLTPLFTEQIKAGQHESLLDLPEETIKQSHSDLMAPLAVLLGAIHHVNVQPHLLASEQQYNQQQAVINFVIR